MTSLNTLRQFLNLKQHNPSKDGLLQSERGGQARYPPPAHLPRKPVSPQTSERISEDQTWRIYDPRLQRYVRFTSEDEMRIWIEHQYCLEDVWKYGECNQGSSQSP